MQEMTAQSWKRRGCSIVWSPELLSALITDTEATPLRIALEWRRHGLPESPPGGGKTVLVGGLQTVLEVMPDSGRGLCMASRKHPAALPHVEQSLGRRWSRVRHGRSGQAVSAQ